MKGGLGILLSGLMAAFTYAALRASPYLAELPFMPAPIGRWVDAHPDMRHMVGYLVMAVVGALAYCAGRPAERWLAFGLGMLFFATLLEAAQFFLPNRHADWRDLAWSCLGILAGLGGMWAVDRSVRRRKK
jgi:VanZ family protein